VDAIRIPSDRSHAQRRESLVAGLVIDRQVHESLLRLAAAAPAH
jgi:LDH2 family malate/lactate/ureidoglycolate dehydrogenase